MCIRDSLKGLCEVVTKSCGIVVAKLGQDIRFLCVKFVFGKVRVYGTLERIQETDTEIMGVTLCYLRVCTGDADGRDTCLLEYVRSCDGYAGTVGTKYYGYLVSCLLYTSRCV